VAIISTRSRPLTITRTAVLALCLFGAALALVAGLHDEPAGAGLTPAEAEVAALHDPQVRAATAGGFTRVRTMPLDDHTVRVGFFDGPRAVAEAAVDSGGRVRAVITHDRRHARVGSDVGQRLPVLIGFVVVFLAATLRVPLVRRENLDAAALASLTVPIVLVNERYLELSVLCGAALLAFLGWRCLTVAAAGCSEGGSFLVERLPARATTLTAVGAAGALALVSIPGGLVSDVGYASMAGATQILDGRLPYGNLPTDGLVHGDTYPLLAYLAYVPAALISPVYHAFADLDGALWVATAFALAAALVLGRVGGPRSALAFLAFPPLMVAASSGSNDTVAAALVACVLAAAARAGAASGALAAAAWVKVAPAAVLPIWFARGRRSAIPVAVAVAVTVATAGFVFALGGPAGFAEMARSLSFQAERGSFMSVWAEIDFPAAQIAFQAALITGIVMAGLWAWRDRALAGDARRLAALAAAVLIGVQLAVNHWSATYLAWLFPLLAVALLSGGRSTPSPPRARASSPRAARR
jgi:hypothetical protein